MKNMIFTAAVIACLAFLFCGTLTSQEQTQGLQNKMELVIEPGGHWLSKMKTFIFNYTLFFHPVNN